MVDRPTLVYSNTQDELWMLKGGKVLYVLRPKQLDTSATSGVLDATGGLHGLRNLYFQGTGYS